MYHYWALFDGHAGSGAAVVAARLLQHHIACQLQAVIEIDPTQCSLPSPHCARRGARQQPLPPRKHPRAPPAHTDPGSLSPRSSRRTGVALQHPTSTEVFLREEGAAREPGRRSHRECLQRDGETKNDNISNTCIMMLDN